KHRTCSPQPVPIMPVMTHIDVFFVFFKVNLDSDVSIILLERELGHIVVIFLPFVDTTSIILHCI
ncbi:hypothetical protein ACJX0J_042414, partial [Zea mays]